MESLHHSIELVQSGCRSDQVGRTEFRRTYPLSGQLQTCSYELNHSDDAGCETDSVHLSTLQVGRYRIREAVRHQFVRGIGGVMQYASIAVN